MSKLDAYRGIARKHENRSKKYREALVVTQARLEGIVIEINAGVDQSITTRRLGRLADFIDDTLIPDSTTPHPTEGD